MAGTPITVRFSDADLEALDRVAAARGSTRSGAVRAAVAALDHSDDARRRAAIGLPPPPDLVRLRAEVRRLGINTWRAVGAASMKGELGADRLRVAAESVEAAADALSATVQALQQLVDWEAWAVAQQAAEESS